MKLNVARRIETYEGGQAVEVNSHQQLRRTVLACLLFEDNFYESGVSAVDRIKELCTKCTCSQVMQLADLAANRYHLRHVPLQLIVEALKKQDKPANMAEVISSICKRPDQLTDILALYWKDGKKPLAYQLKKGLAKSFSSFDRYQLSKYNRDNPIKLRDVLFLTHPKPKDEEQAQLWKDLANKTLGSADTWEVRLSAGENKNESFTDLLTTHCLGKLAILRNLRNMLDSGVSKELIASELIHNPKEMLPFQYLAAAKECPQWEDIVDKAMIQACSLKPKLKGTTIVLVDVSGSMKDKLSAKSKMTRMDAACGLAILLRECCSNAAFFSFSDACVPIPPRQGMALRDALVKSQPNSATHLGDALRYINDTANCEYDRIIVITDEQTADDISRMPSKKNYILNIAGYQNGIGEKNQWVTITGFSEASIDFIREYENEMA